MTATRPTARDLIVTAISRHPDQLADLSVIDLAAPDDEVLRRLGWRLVNSGDREAFRTGRRLLQKTSHGRLFPPPHPRWWTGPSEGALGLSAVLNPYSIDVSWKDGGPEWQVGGRLWVRGEDRDWRWYPLLHVDTCAELARTNLMRSVWAGGCSMLSDDMTLQQFRDLIKRMTLPMHLCVRSYFFKHGSSDLKPEDIRTWVEADVEGYASDLSELERDIVECQIVRSIQIRLDAMRNGVLRDVH